MLDAMLIVHRCQELKTAEFCRAPDSPLEPTVWVDEGGALCAWHPLMRGVIRTSCMSPEWTADEFSASVTDVREGMADHLHELFEEAGTPVSYYSSYPSVVTDLRNERASFTVAATEQDEDAAPQDANPKTKKRPPALDDILRKGRGKKA